MTKVIGLRSRGPESLKYTVPEAAVVEHRGSLDGVQLSLVDFYDFNDKSSCTWKKENLTKVFQYEKRST
jgi:hypothetical protein